MMTSGMFSNWFLPGIWITVQVTVYCAALMAVVAFGVGALRTSDIWIVRFLSGAYFEIFRGTSALVLMFWMFFALPCSAGSWRRCGQASALWDSPTAPTGPRSYAAPWRLCRLPSARRGLR